MTNKEIDKFLSNTKVSVNSKSKEILEKLFSLGYNWQDTVIKCTKSSFRDVTYLYIYKDRTIAWGCDAYIFKEHEHREISAEKILSIELTEPTYRPFNTREECRSEMHKHPDFGWVIYKGHFVNICDIGMNFLTICPDEHTETWDLSKCINEMTFTDNIPFGIKEE